MSAIQVCKVKKRYFCNLYYDQGYIWEAMCWEMTFPPVMCGYRRLDVDENEAIRVTDVAGITAPLSLREIRSAYGTH
jgi:hypothetical protein